MPLCVKCKSYLPPNYTEVIPNSQQDFEGNYPQECIFCKLGVYKVERETSPDSGEFVFYTKEECIRDYKEFLNRLKEKQSAKEILKGADKGF